MSISHRVNIWCQVFFGPIHLSFLKDPVYTFKYYELLPQSVKINFWF